MNPLLILSVAAGGALGSVARYMVNIGAGRMLGTGFPFGTLIVNIVGCCIIGFLAEAMALRWNLGLEWRSFLIVGILGGFTTFSAFALDTMVLLQRGANVPALIYICASVLLSLGGAMLGILGAKGLWA